ncbi:MAG: sigma 54-interacting transcriptional regulator [Pseudomonadota bacterium]
MTGANVPVPQTVYVSAGSTGLFERVASALAHSALQLHRVDSLPADITGLPANAVAIVSTCVLEHERSWYGEYDLPVIWVGGQRPTGDMLDPMGGHALLPPDFTDAELQAMVGSMMPPPGSDTVFRLANGMPVVARSQAMLNMLDEVMAFADSDHNVLIEGETGVGKEVIAELLHRGHHRYSSGSFIAVNCGAIPDGLFESLFFGHTRGAFTGALQSHKGYLEQAHGGTLFLDEIGELPQFQQVKLLRVLQSGDVTRVGAEQPEHFDFRLIAATNRSLREQVRHGNFRTDLFYRLAVIELHVPNLEQRGATDKVAIFEAMLANMTGPMSGERLVTPVWLKDQVATMRFNGNVRQLQNLAERVGVIVRQTGDWDMRLISRALEQVLQSEAPAGHASRKKLDSEERDRIIAELDRNHWQRQKTADHLGMSRKSLWEKMRKYGIEDHGRV